MPSNPCYVQCFSALQRAENSSIRRADTVRVMGVKVSVLFSEPKIPQYIALFTLPKPPKRFSALQRAENSSILGMRRLLISPLIVSVLFSEPKIPQSYDEDKVQEHLQEFQCSSASRKFLNLRPSDDKYSPANVVSVLFSEPKIPQ